MTERVTNGNREMPAWDEVLTQQEIDDVIAYVRALIQQHAAAAERG
jgi:mono/diheme cytochrome c family protein